MYSLNIECLLLPIKPPLVCYAETPRLSKAIVDMVTPFLNSSCFNAFYQFVLIIELGSVQSRCSFFVSKPYC